MVQVVHRRYHLFLFVTFFLMVSVSLATFIYSIKSYSSKISFFPSDISTKKKSLSTDFPVFPVEGSKISIQKSDVGYYYNCISRCHDTYEATDIGSEAGKKIYAIDNGVIIDTSQTSVAQGKKSGGSVRMKTESGWYVYYTHLASQRVIVRTGQSVRAGDIIGYMGTSEDAQGSPNHLHIDISIIENGFSRGVNLCSEECRSLVAPQPMLRRAYDKLPEN